MAITLGEIDNSVQLGLRNTVGTPFSQNTRVETYNRVIDFLQSKANWNCTKRVTAFDYLNQETDYSLANSLSIADFKQYKDLRFVDTDTLKQQTIFEEISPDDFPSIVGRGALYNALTFEDRDNDKIMRVLTSKNQGDTIVDAMEDLTTNRTWSADTTNSDASNLVADDTRSKSGSCLKFDVDVSQSGNNYAEIYTSTVFTTTIDASDILNNGYFRFWLGLHNVSAANLALISSVRFVWGTDSSNYWYKDTTTAINNGVFKAAWNRVSFDWASATKTGSPDESALKYFAVRITYAAGFTDSNNIRVDEIKMFEPLDMELVYFSKYFVSNAGTWQQRFTTTSINTSEQLLLPDAHYNLFVNLALQRLFPKKERSSEDYVRVTNEIKEQLPLAINQDGNPITREKNEFRVNGYSSGRDDLSTMQW